jgi:hypothetical protein
VEVTNKVTGESTLFNSLRALKPAPTRGSTPEPLRSLVGLSWCAKLRVVGNHADEAAENALDEQLEQSKGEDKCALPHALVGKDTRVLAGEVRAAPDVHSRRLFTTLRGCESMARSDVERLHLWEPGRMTSKGPPEQESGGYGRCDFCAAETRTAAEPWGRVRGDHCVTCANIARAMPLHGLVLFGYAARC